MTPRCPGPSAGIARRYSNINAGSPVQTTNLMEVGIMTMRVLLVPLLILVLVATAVADEGGIEKQEHKVIVTTPEAGAGAYATVLGTEHGAVVVGEHHTQALHRLQELIEGLVESGDLTEKGADKLRKALGGMDGPQAYSTLNICEEPGKVAMKVIVKDGEGEQERKVITVMPEGRTEIKAHTLTIIADDDGHVTIDGEGFSEEQLAEIREQVEKHGSAALKLEGIHELLEDGHHAEAFEEAHRHHEMLMLELEDLKELEQLKELEEFEGLEGLEGHGVLMLEGLAELEGLKELQFLGELGKLEELQELEGLEGLEVLKELEELEGLHILGELGELQELEELPLLEDLPGLKAIELEELYELHESDVDELLGLKGYEALIEDWAEDFEADLEAEIEDILEQVEDLLRDFAERHAH
jgi:hypothetical protein